MANSMAVAAKNPVHEVHQYSWEILANDHSAIADLDDSETLYTADFTIPAHATAVAFLVTTTGDTTAAHTAAITLMHGVSQANGAVTDGLVRAGSPLPATTITLDMGTAADRNVLLHVNPAGYDADGVAVSTVVSLRFVGAGSIDNTVVRVTCLVSGKRHLNR